MDRRALKFMQKRYFLFSFILVFSSHLIWKTCMGTYVYVCMCTYICICVSMHSRLLLLYY